jgi:hypothetical protein
VIGDVVGFLEVVVGAGCYLLEEEELGAATAENEANSVEQFLLCLELVFVEEVLGKT